MLALLFGTAAGDSSRIIEARSASAGPRVDGFLEPVWTEADSAIDFVQRRPDFGKPASESTTAYVLCDPRNLYVAFRCRVRDPRTVYAALSGASDGVQVFLDPYDDDATGYAFAVRTSGAELDYRLTEDGGWDQDWDGVWHSAVRLYPWGYAVEMAIPFKTLRYQAGNEKWGIDFGRHVVVNNERSYWCRHDQTHFRVSNLGELCGIRPGAQGLHLEVYPVGILELDQDSSLRVSPEPGLDLAWLPSPTTNLQLTVLPDFAQIEADPYQVNLSKYELTLQERRPFFLEAAETFGTGSQLFQMFYSRRIGRPLPDGQVVPILGGGKFTGRFRYYSIGALAALTSRTDYQDGYGNDSTEPASFYGAASLRRQILGNSEWGVRYAGKEDTNTSNHGLGTDAILRRGGWTTKLALAGSRLDRILGYSFAGEAEYRSTKLAGGCGYRQIAPEFDVNGVGYTGWRGQTFHGSIGPEFYGSGLVHYASLAPSFSAGRDWDDPGLSWSGSVTSSAQLHNRSSATAWAQVSRTADRDSAWYIDTTYWNYSWGLNTSTDEAEPFQLSAWANYISWSYNYRRASFFLRPNWWFAPNASGGVLAKLQLGNHLRLELEADGVLEFRPGHALDFEEDVTVVVTPVVHIDFTPKMSLRLRGEAVRSFVPLPEPYEPVRYRSWFGSVLYSWTFRPRSTLYVALDQTLDNYNRSGELALAERVAVLKLRYLFVF